MFIAILPSNLVHYNIIKLTLKKTTMGSIYVFSALRFGYQYNSWRHTVQDGVCFKWVIYEGMLFRGKSQRVEVIVRNSSLHLEPFHS